MNCLMCTDNMCLDILLSAKWFVIATALLLCVLPMCRPHPMFVSVLCLLNSTVHFTPGLHQLINSPSNAPVFPAVVARSCIKLQW